MECSGNGRLTNNTCACSPGWSGMSLWKSYNDCQVNQDVVFILNSIALAFATGLLLVSFRGCCGNRSFLQKDSFVCMLALSLNQFLFAGCIGVFASLAMAGVTFGERRPDFLAVYVAATSAFLCQIIVVSFLWLRTFPESRLSKMAILGMGLVWLCGIVNVCIFLLDEAQYGIIRQIVTAGVAGGALVCWLLVAYSLLSTLRILRNLRRVPSDLPPLPRKSSLSPMLKVSTSSMFARGSLFKFDNILDRMTCHACTTALLLVVMGIPGIVILVCLAIPLEFVERHSHYYFNGVFLWAILLSVRVNLMYTFKADEGLDSLAKTKRALSRGVPDYLSHVSNKIPRVMEPSVSSYQSLVTIGDI